MKALAEFKKRIKEVIMKNQILCGVVACLLAGGLAVAEDVKPSYPFTVEKSIGAATFADKTYDQVWGAVIKNLVKSHYRLGVVEKDAGVIEAFYDPPDSKFWGKKDGEGQTMSVFVESGDSGVLVSLTWGRGKKIVIRGMQAQLRKVYGQFFQAVADILYPPEREN